MSKPNYLVCWLYTQGKQPSFSFYQSKFSAEKFFHFAWRHPELYLNVYLCEIIEGRFQEDRPAAAATWEMSAEEAHHDLTGE